MSDGDRDEGRSAADPPFIRPPEPCGDAKEHELEVLRMKARILDEITPNLHELVTVWDAASERHLYITPSFEAIFHEPVARMWENGDWWLSRVHQDDIPKMAALADEMRRSGGYEEEFRILRPDGEVRWINSRAESVTDAEGRHMRVFGVTRDITAQKRAEQRLQEHNRELEARIAERTRELEQANAELTRALDKSTKAEAAVRRAETRYRTVADFTWDWEYWTAPEGTLLYVSPSCERITGYPPEAFMADPSLLDRLVVQDEARDRGAQACVCPVKRGQQFRIRHRDGRERWVEHHCREVVDADGVSRGVRASNRDVTERLAAAAEAERHRNDLARLARIATLGELTAAIAHQLGQPLMAVLAYAQAAQRFEKSGNPEDLETSLNGVVKQALRAHEVIDRLRKLLSGAEPKLERTDLAALVREVLMMMESETATVDVELTEALDAAPPVRADRVQLEQVVMNIMLNALEAMKGTRGVLRITVDSVADASVRLCIADTGPGIADVDRIFEPFYSTKKSLGVGLAISRTVIEAHGGALRVESTRDGATFCITLPTDGGA